MWSIIYTNITDIVIYIYGGACWGTRKYVHTNIIEAILTILTMGVPRVWCACFSVLGSFFCVPRIMYAMGADGLLFSFMGKIHATRHTPANATFLGGILAGSKLIGKIKLF